MITKNNIIKLFAVGMFLVFAATFTVCKRVMIQTVLPQSAAETKNYWTDEPIIPIEDETDLDQSKVDLGEKLFNEKQLSHDDSISCASCHNLNLGGADQRVHSLGINGRPGSINAPTVFNSSHNFKQFWDGRADTLEDQIDGPTHKGSEMGSDWEEISQKLNSSPDYVSTFSKLYKDGIQTENIKDAIATFERSLTTPNSRFDQFLKGNENILTKEEKEGYRIFKSVGCASCHQGVNIGGNLFQEFGVMGDYFNDRGNITEADLGRFNVTKKEIDRYVFKVPSLRNIELTAPYFHDGSAETLEEAVGIMSKYQIGRKLSSDETAAIVQFLRSLNGDYKKYKQQ